MTEPAAGDPNGLLGPERDASVPVSALVISLGALLVPVAGTLISPEWVTSEEAGVVWLLPVIPAFLLSYYRGWKGASAALAVGMVTLSTSVGLFDLLGVPTPGSEVYVFAVSALIVVTLGSGGLASAFRRSLDLAEMRALTDQTTGIPNRRYGVLGLDRAFAAAKRGKDLSVVLFDLDRFKEVNDRHGHAVGDEALRAFATILDRNTRAMDISARYGGEEFVTVMEAAGSDEARVFAERVRREMEEHKGAWGTLTVSAGVASYEDGMASPDVLLAAADQALYRAKAGGRNRVVVTGRRGGTRTRPRDRSRTGEGQIRYQGIRILVVDDDEATVDTLGNVLRRSGFSVLGSTDPRRAVSIARGLGEPVDLVLTDIMMPTMSGFRLVEILSEDRSPPAVVYMSGYEQQDVDWGGVPGASTAFLSKPLELEVLLGTIEEVLRSADATEGVEEPEVDREDDGSERRAPEAPAEADPDRSQRPPRDERPGLPVLGLDDSGAVASAIRAAGLEPRPVDPSELTPEAIGDGLVLIFGSLPMPDQAELARVLERARTVPPLVVWWNRTDDRSGALDGWLIDEGEGADRLTGALLRLRARLARLRTTSLVGPETPELEAVVAARTAELEDARDDVVLRLARAAEYRDDLTGRHALRVGRLSSLLGAELGLESDECKLLEKAAPLHDVGKIAIPDAILRKPDRLTPSEREVMESHTEVGAQLLSGSRFQLLQVAAEIAHRHHERWDGSGYPDGLEAQEIPLVARIVAVADVFDSLTHLRPYRNAAPMDEGVAELRRERGRQFDPAVVDAFERLYDEGRIQSAEEATSVVAHPDRQGPGRSPASGLEGES